MLNNPPEDAAPSERTLVLIAYGLFILALPSGGITALIGGMIAFVKRDEARGTPWESHYRNLLTVFWAGLIFWAVMLSLAFSGMIAALGLMLGTAWLDGGFMLGLPLLGMGVPLMLLASGLFALWCIWRIVRGFLRALDDKGY